MSTRERDRLRGIEAVCERRMNPGHAAMRLSLSVRDMKRRARAYRRDSATNLRLEAPVRFLAANGSEALNATAPPLARIGRAAVNPDNGRARE